MIASITSVFPDPVLWSTSRRFIGDLGWISKATAICWGFHLMPPAPKVFQLPVLLPLLCCCRCFAAAIAVLLPLLCLCYLSIRLQLEQGPKQHLMRSSHDTHLLMWMSVRRPMLSIRLLTNWSRNRFRVSLMLSSTLPRRLAFCSWSVEMLGNGFSMPPSDAIKALVKLATRSLSWMSRVFTLRLNLPPKTHPLNGENSVHLMGTRVDTSMESNYIAQSKLLASVL